MSLTVIRGSKLGVPFIHALDENGNNVALVALHPDTIDALNAGGGGGGGVPNPLPVTGPLTDDELRAAPLDVNMTADDPIPVTLPAKTSLTAAVTASTTTGNTTAGARMVSFQNTGTANATVAGGTLPPGQTLTFEAPSDATIGAISYVATGTTLLIATLS